MKLENALEKWLGNYCGLVILGIGSSLRKDDAVGVEILRRLVGRVPKNVRLIDCEAVPEKFTGKIRLLKPSHVLLIDAADLGCEAGEARLVPVNKIAGVALSTHAMPLYMLAEIVKKSVEAKVVLLGVQPKDVGFGEGLSSETEKAVERVVEVLVNVLNKATVDD